MKSKLGYWLFGFSLLLLLAGFVMEPNEGKFESVKKVIVMRKIADEVMRYLGDSTSGIAPVEKHSSHQYEIPFKSSFTFKPDSLVRIINAVLKSNHLQSDYIVQLKEAGKDEIIYGYAFIHSKQQDIIPCSGREQPLLNYSIHIQFKDSTPISSKTMYLLGIGCFSMGLLFISFIKKQKEQKWPLNESKIEVFPANRDQVPLSASIPTTKVYIIGQFQFFPDELILLFQTNRIELTLKETKLLSIFAQQPNMVIDRSRLQKEVWEDEGVVVGRSLDMFISKLRKKLEPDPKVKIINIHSKGYKLEIGKVELTEK